jgi:hypothetical protein
MTLYFDMGRNHKQYAPDYIQPPRCEWGPFRDKPMTWNDLIELAETTPYEGEDHDWPKLNEFLEPLFQAKKHTTAPEVEGYAR